MYDFLKKLFKEVDGQPEAITAEELAKRIQEDKTLNIVNLKDGGYVSKDKFDAKDTELTGVKQQLEDANKQIQSYKDMDVDGIKKSVADWEQKYTEDTAALKKQMEDQEYAHQKDMFFSGVKFSSNAAKVGMMAEFDKQEFQLKDGTFVGADKWLEDQKESDAASFVVEKAAEDSKEETGGQQTTLTAPTFPNFATATSTGSGISDGQMNPFNLGLRRVRGEQNETK